MIQGEDVEEIIVGLSQLSINFRNSPDKERCWQYILSLTKHQSNNVRIEAVKTLGLIFHYVIDKENAWLDLISLTESKYGNVRRFSVPAIVNKAYPNMGCGTELVQVEV